MRLTEPVDGSIHRLCANRTSLVRTAPEPTLDTQRVQKVSASQLGDLGAHFVVIEADRARTASNDVAQGTDDMGSGLHFHPTLERPQSDPFPRTLE